MIGLFTKKKFKEDKVANIFVNSLLSLIDEGFQEVAALINEDPEFDIPPSISPADNEKFLLIVFSGNMKFIPDFFHDYQDVRLIDKIISKLSQSIGVEKDYLKKTISEYQSFQMRVNHPSKNIHYAMSKAIFFKYDLVPYQQEYFRNMKAPNPIFLKRLDEIVSHFIWDWPPFLDKYRVVE